MAEPPPTKKSHFNLKTRNGVLNFFNAADVDRTGNVTIKELRAAMNRQGHYMSSGQLQKQFDIYDLNGDECLSRDEFLLCMGHLPPKVHEESKIMEMFKAFDINGDGKLDRQELREVLRATNPRRRINEAELDKIMYLIDKDRNGYIDYGEFLIFFKKRKQ